MINPNPDADAARNSQRHRFSAPPRPARPARSLQPRVRSSQSGRRARERCKPFWPFDRSILRRLRLPARTFSATRTSSCSSSSALARFSQEELWAAIGHQQGRSTGPAASTHETGTPRFRAAARHSEGDPAAVLKLPRRFRLRGPPHARIGSRVVGAVVMPAARDRDRGSLG